MNYHILIQLERPRGGPNGWIETMWIESTNTADDQSFASFDNALDWAQGRISQISLGPEYSVWKVKDFHIQLRS